MSLKHLPTLDAARRQRQAMPKGEPKKRTKTRTQRAHAQDVKAVRAAVFERDHHTCRICGQLATEMHERIYRSQGGQVSLENSVATCRACHRALHAKTVRMP